jgi:hypothetical protein
VAVVLAGLGAVVASTTNVAGNVDLKAELAIFAASLVAAGGLRVTAFVSEIEAWIADKTAGWGIG